MFTQGLIAGALAIEVGRGMVMAERRMHPYLKALGDTIMEGFIVVALCYMLWNWLQTSRDEPGVLLRKFCITFGILFLTARAGLFLARTGTFSLMPYAIVMMAVGLSILWAPNIAEWLVRPITSALDGGGEQLEARAYYSIARGLRAKGRYEQAIEKIQEQLAKFPGNFEGMILMAEIEMENLQDMAAAQATLEKLLKSPRQSPQNITAALNTLADWHLKFAKDHEAARRDLERIVELYPGSEAALGAAQRIAHLGADEKPWSLRERRKVFVPEGVKNYGLSKEKHDFAPVEIKPEEQATQLVAHLNQHPLDNEAREKLALLYATHYNRPDMAAEHFEQMIGQPNASVRNVTHWLNALADLHVKAEDHEKATQTLQRIVDRFPNSAASDMARNRIELLNLEMRAGKKSQAVRLGSYEQNIGLKYGAPRRS